MKRLTIFLIITLTLISLLIGGSSLAQDNCPSGDSLDVEKSSVYCWLAIKQPESFKYLKKQLQTAVNDVWKWDQRQSLPTNVRLQSLEKVSPQNLPSELDQNEVYYRGVTWANKGFADSARKALKENNGKWERGKYIWITPVSQTQSFCQTCKGSLVNPQIPPSVNKRLRITQYLGLRLTSNKTHFVTLIAKKSDLEIPCINYDNDNQCDTPMSSDKLNDFIQNNEDLVSKCDLEDENSDKECYPWTALGYTYDWGKKDHVGASEYVIKPHAKVYIESVAPTCQFCGCE
ncbi:MAG: hypothetical protein AB4041_02035 [Microcystaceae cyanobacterium]